MSSVLFYPLCREETHEISSCLHTHPHAYTHSFSQSEVSKDLPCVCVSVCDNESCWLAVVIGYLCGLQRWPSEWCQLDARQTAHCVYTCVCVCVLHEFVACITGTHLQQVCVCVCTCTSIDLHVWVWMSTLALSTWPVSVWVSVCVSLILCRALLSGAWL